MTAKWVAGVGLALVLVAVVAAQAAAQGGEHRAGLVVRFADGKVQTRCVSFPEETITGEQLLDRSGLKAIVDPMGTLGGGVCSIEGQGCQFPAQDCFCKCVSAQCEYWAYYHLAGDGWQYSQMGAHSYQIRDGDVDGWSWGPGSMSKSTDPPKMTLADVCTAGAAAGATSGQASNAAANPVRYAPFGLAVIALLVAGAVVLRRRSA